MNKRIPLLSLALLACFSFVGRAGERPGPEATDLSLFPPFADGIRRASALVLHEGLPHPSLDAARFKSALATGNTIRIHSYPFYARTLQVTAEDTETLRRLCADAGSYRSYGGPKLCGLFHPNYCLGWRDGDRLYELLICFGCHEMKFYDSRHELIVDVRDDAFQQFRKILEKHQT